MFNSGGGAPRYELDLRLYTADVVFARLRYLYTQADVLSKEIPGKTAQAGTAALCLCICACRCEG